MVMVADKAWKELVLLRRRRELVVVEMRNRI
jgi:hypothetical protein